MPSGQHGARSSTSSRGLDACVGVAPEPNWKHPGAAPLNTSAPNQVWTINCKGPFLTRDGICCYPLTIVDHFNRYVLCCQRFPDVKAEGVHRPLRQLFRRHGLPDAIRSDHGAPFASNGIHGLNRLNAWKLQFGIVHQRMTPASPQENGAHERMHRVLKAQAAKPAAANATAATAGLSRVRADVQRGLAA